MSHALENHEIVLKIMNLKSIIIMCLGALLFYLLFFEIRLDESNVILPSKKPSLTLSRYKGDIFP